MAGDDSLVVLYDIRMLLVVASWLVMTHWWCCMTRMLLVMARWLVMTHCGAVIYTNAVGDGQVAGDDSLWCCMI